MFALFYNTLNSLSDILNSKSLLFLDSKSGDMVPFNSLSIDDYDKIKSNVWYLITKVPNKSKKIYSNILDFYLKSNFSAELNNHDVLFYLSQCINSFYETKDDIFLFEHAKKYFLLLFNSLSKSLKTNVNYERASEIVAFFRGILSHNNEYTAILIEIFHTYKSEDEICSTFAILGGFLDIFHLYLHVTFPTDKEVIKHGILHRDGRVVELPIQEESIPMQAHIYLDFKFISTFLNYVIKDVTSPFAALYLRCFSMLLKRRQWLY